MFLTHEDLTSRQVHLLARLDDGCLHEDSAGRQMTSLPDEALVEAVSFAELGLVSISFGWRDTVWVRLSEAGRRIREWGKVH